MKNSNGFLQGSMALIFGFTSVVLIIPASPAQAATTAVSTVYKTGTDPATGSTALSPDSPGFPGGASGVTHPGDTIDWTVNYLNTTGGDANVDIQDPLTNAGAYVPGSLQFPPSLNTAGSPIAPQYSTDAGATWNAGAPPANANGVGITGSFPTGTQQKGLNFPPPTQVILNTLAGDGYNAVTGVGGSPIYAAFHHSNTAAPNSYLYCATPTGAICPGWPAQSTYASPVAGNPIGSGPNGFTTASDNGTFISDDKLFWEAQSLTAVGGVYPVGVMCADLATLLSCGFTQLDTVVNPTYRGGDGNIGGMGVPAANGNYYFSDTDGRMLCFNVASGACGTVQLFALPSPSTAATFTWSSTYKNFFFTQLQLTTGAPYTVTCYNVAAAATCPGFPVLNPVLSVLPLDIMPIVSPAGTLTGFCNNGNTAGTSACWTLTGATVPNPFPTGVGGAVADSLLVQTKVYASTFPGDQVVCFDFALFTGVGTVPPCTGFAPVTNVRNYTTREVSGVPGCLIADGDGKQIIEFSGATGGPCTLSTTSTTVTPPDSYCRSGAAGFHGWTTVALTGLAPGSYTNAAISLFDANDDPVPGFQNVLVPAGASLDISSIPTTSPTSTLNASVTLEDAQSTVTAGQVVVSWDGDATQMCFQTIAPPVACAQSGVVSNDAVAVTAGASGSDSPAGNSSGVTSFTNTPLAAQCALQITKTSSSPASSPGGSLTYTVAIQNTGQMPYVAPAPAQASDDLTNVLTNASYNNDATVNTGTVSYASPVLNWSGDLAPGQTATITYSVTVNSPDAGNHLLTNTVTSPSVGSNCAVGSLDPACASQVPVSDITMVKSVSPNGPSDFFPGQSVTYSFLVTNTGQVDLTPITVNETAFTGSGGPLAITCPSSTLAPGASETCAAPYTLTQQDVDNGDVENTATATGCASTAPAVCVTSESSSTQLPVTPNPSVTLVKSASPTTVTHAGDVVTYSFDIQNTGNVTLTNIAVTETAFSGTGTLSAVSCPEPQLISGQTETCTATYVATQADIDSGSISNTAEVHATDPDAAPVLSNLSSAMVLAAPAPALTVVKSADTGVISAVGQVVTYSFFVTNTGNVTLTGVTVTDTQTAPAGPLDGPVSCPATTLAPTISTTCTATYTVIQADLDNGSLNDTATATGTPPNGPAVTSPPSAVSIPSFATGALSVVKTADTDVVYAVGQEVTYTFLVTNNGAHTLTGVTVTDIQGLPGDMLSSDPNCPETVLDPGESMTCTATFVVTEADMSSPSHALTDTATAGGTLPNGTPVTSPPSTVEIPSAAPALTILKQADTATITHVGQVITYSFVVTNTGNTPLTDVAVTDVQVAPASPLTTGPACPATTLAPAASTTCTATYTVTQADLDNGSVSDHATASGTSPTGDTLSDPSAVLLPTAPPPTTTPPAGQTTPAGSTLAATGLTLLWPLLATGIALITTGIIYTIGIPTARRRRRQG